ncbi:hypothetical protein [Klebsiella variicola]|uniref:hypothetical protein n=1 Tax=Klebsiella variicola TaxID=244366 RepID=UPI0015D495CC|nr:hypothetical protein [Klebsiella variicola]
MRKSLIAIFTAASVLLTCGISQASDTYQSNQKETCKKPSEPPKDKDGKPIPPPDGKKPPVGKDCKPLPPPDGCLPPQQDKPSN